MTNMLIFLHNKLPYFSYLFIMWTDITLRMPQLFATWSLPVPQLVKSSKGKTKFCSSIIGDQDINLLNLLDLSK